MIKIGMVQDNLNMLDHHVALAKGHYREQGLDVELVVQPGKEAIRALASGEVLLSSFTSRVMDAILKEGIPFKFVLFTRNGPPHYIVSRPDIKSARDLKGKILRTGGEGGTNYYMTLDWLRDNGLRPGADVTLISNDAAPADFFSSRSMPSWARASLRGSADAMMTGVLESLLLKEAAGYNVLVDLPEAYPGRMVHGLAGHVDTLRRQPEAVKKIVRAHMGACNTIRDDKKFCVALIEDKWSVSERIAAAAWEIMRPRFISAIDPKWLDSEIEYFLSHIEKDNGGKLAVPAASSLVDATFMDGA